MSARRPRLREGRRGISGLGLILVVFGLLGLAIAYSAVPRETYRLWPLVLVALGAFGLLKRPGWVAELDLAVGPEVGRALDRPRRRFSLLLVLSGLALLLFTLHVVDERIAGPVVIIGVGLLLLWRRSR